MIFKYKENGENKMLTLKDCPFCGSYNIDFRTIDVRDYRIICKHCNMQVELARYCDKEELVEAWNKRFPWD